MNNQSYTAASTVPAKLFCDNNIVDGARNHRIMPRHLQTNLTNKCPLNCSFCSCAKRDKTLEMPFDIAKAMTEKFIELGIRAVTNTGGGDPLCYKPLPEYIKFLSEKKIDASLVTNGIMFKNFNLDVINLLTWCRISLSDNREFNPSEIREAVKIKTGWSFSYVISQEDPNIPNIINMIEFANNNGFTHIRIVDDILDNRNISKLHILKDILDRSRVDTSKVIWQGRKEYTKGHPRCLISLLKPNITPDGMFVGCCGIQYSSNPPMLDWPRFYSMGTIDEIDLVYKNQNYWDGTKCERCYYSDYNVILNAMWNSAQLEHQGFV